jgi:ABC-type uncharacterized transport system auxiliary subunit
MKATRAGRVLIFAALIAGCGLYIDRASAIEACAASRSVFDQIPNPSAGQVRPPANQAPNVPENPPRPERLPPRGTVRPYVQPQWINPTPAVMRQRIAQARSLAEVSRDRKLRQIVDRLRLVGTEVDQQFLQDWFEVIAYCESKAY